MKIHTVFWDSDDTIFKTSSHGTEIREGVLEALDYFKKNDVDQAVVSNSSRKSVMEALEAKNLTSYFKVILCKEDYKGSTPAPASYLKAFEKIQTIRGEKLSTKHCLIIDDNPLILQTAQATGMTVLYRPIDDVSSIIDFVS